LYNEDVKFLKKWWREVALGTLLFANIAVWAIVWEKRPSDLLRVYFLDVGQGNAILIDSPTHGRILYDGGPNSKVLSEIGKLLPFGDRRIDVVIGSHPDADHIGGLIDVVRRYKVGAFIEPGVESKSQIDDTLRAEVSKRRIPILLARAGMKVVLEEGIEFQILFPDREISDWETNDASIVGKLIYQDKSFLLTGDSTKKVEYLLLFSDPNILKSDVLQVGHHGSKTSTSLIYAEAVSPEYAVISTSKDNSYGHPHKEVLDILDKVNAKILNTADFGTIKFETNGQTLKLK